MFCDLVRH
ncbi:Branched-chain amino acid transport system permease protein LivM [Caballeronia sordidicola]|uniref:Branched-chain amino acid transport system permease protein LivM n=1 Tax=Caballeronia sordidicola TaxID=196367 RepID=A0A242N661_CABSO|nr:Branched-chain amino acid transport system permease protein LivM [Caballeronia sordidicola]OTP79131.1 Branched-chain amino acid transport system permease protein LivM [Caballeronia sordidicola]